MIELNKIYNMDCREGLKLLADSSVDLVITDPPYFLDKMADNWDNAQLNKQTKSQLIKNLPSGMKFDKQQGKDLIKWYSEISKEVYRILKPGGFFLSFSSPRLYHCMATAVDNADFEIRDMFLWVYTQSMPKAMQIKDVEEGWKTPQLKSCFEPIVFAQKPIEKSYSYNMNTFNVGGINTNIRVGEDKFPANILTTHVTNEVFDNYFLVNKPSKKEKGEFNFHKTVKPLDLIKHLINLCLYNKNGIVLDPFIGSGTTAIACKQLNRNFIGFEINPEYCKIAEERLNTDFNTKI